MVSWLRSRFRDLPDDVVERHRWRARRHGRSLEAELRAVLERTALLSKEEWRP
ncbi:MAG: Arc family DNA-binding protein [Euzebyaceae bacterium]|nr:Arc family DNA-binding protein [Euzebyaceae bacterium]